MERTEQKRIVNEMLKGHAETMRELVKHVPEDWDGHELRQLFADRATEDFVTRKYLTGKRLKDYKNTRLVQNL